MEDLPGRLTSRYLEPGGGDGRARIAGAVRSIVRFERHNLAVDAPPRPPYDVVVCRNVVIYFDRGAQRRVFRHLVDSLAPGGILVLGKTETLHGVPVRDRLALDNVAERVYVRV